MGLKPRFIACVVALVLAAPAWGHHSRSMYESDDETAITVAGTVTEVLWGNPHVYIYLDVANGEGQIQNWALEGGSPHQLTAQGWPLGLPQSGDEISVIIWPLKTGGRGGVFRTVNFANGSTFVYTSATR